MDSIAVVYVDTNGLFKTRFLVNKNGNGFTYGCFYCTGLLTAPNIYNMAQVDNLLTGKPNTLICRDPTQLNPLVQGFQLLGGANISRCSSCSSINLNVLW